MSCVICCEKLFEHIDRLKAGARGGAGPAVGTNGDWQDRPSVLQCGHVFHQGCIGAWLAQSNRSTCPTCRSKQNGDPIALYFEADEVEDAAAGNSHPQKEGDSLQVKHRNKIIKTLCANVEAAQAESKSLRERCKALEEKYSLKELEHTEEALRSQKLKEEATAAKNSAARRKMRVMKLEGDVAEKESKIELLESQAAQLKAELQEQIQVVKGMGDVRAASEQLMRSLRKERTRNATLASLNRKFAARVAALERAPAVSQDAGSAQRPSAMDSTASTIPKVDLASSSDQETDLGDDGPVSIGRAPVHPWNKLGTSKPAARLMPTFDVPLSEFESGGSTASNASSTAAAKVAAARPTVLPTRISGSNGSSGASSSQTKNPFAVSARSKAGVMPGDFTFSMDIDFLGPAYSTMAARDAKKNERATKAVRKPASATVSDGMGGSRRRFSNSRSGNVIQAKINFGAKKP
ncbi:hypothetical protein GQ54DRAFT_298164 [Martensiomyces pterosporus]|nr:hypothetical protein GQ54DRAFT_298164 [Martensiomyces pterosporus]